MLCVCSILPMGVLGHSDSIFVGISELTVIDDQKTALDVPYLTPGAI
jgi:hypothetical protein